MKAGSRAGDLVEVLVVRDITIEGVTLSCGTALALPRETAARLAALGAVRIEREKAVLAPCEIRCP